MQASPSSVQSDAGFGAFVRETIALYRRALLKLTRRPIALYFSLVQPLIWLLLFGQIFDRLASSPQFRAGFGGQSYLAFFAPAVIVQGVLFGAAQSGLSLINDLDSGFLGKLLTAPIHRFSILLGRLLGDLTRMVVQALAILIATFLAGIRFGPEGMQFTIVYAHNVLSVLGIVVLVILFGAIMAGLSVGIALSTRNSETTFAITQFLTLPLIFTSSAQLPIEFMPNWLQVIAHANPVTYAINAMRIMLYGSTMAPAGSDANLVLLQSLVILVLLAAIMLSWGTSRFQNAVRS